jgi:hypothetical protein
VVCGIFDWSNVEERKKKAMPELGDVFWTDPRGEKPGSFQSWKLNFDQFNSRQRSRPCSRFVVVLTKPREAGKVEESHSCTSFIVLLILEIQEEDTHGVIESNILGNLGDFRTGDKP